MVYYITFNKIKQFFFILEKKVLKAAWRKNVANSGNCGRSGNSEHGERTLTAFTTKHGGAQRKNMLDNSGK